MPEGLVSKYFFYKFSKYFFQIFSYFLEFSKYFFISLETVLRADSDGVWEAGKLCPEYLSFSSEKHSGISN